MKRIIQFLKTKGMKKKKKELFYDKGWECFLNFCLVNKINPYKASTENFCDFLIKITHEPSEKTGKMLAQGTITLYQSAINKIYMEKGINPPLNNPKIKSLCKGLSKLRENKPRRVKAITSMQIKKMLTLCSNKTLIGLRDASIISLGFAAALRRSEICNLNVEDIEIFENNNKNSRRMFVYIRKSKTDQTGLGQRIAVIDGKYIKPIKRLERWLKASKIKKGVLFQTMRRNNSVVGSRMHPSDIPRIIKHYGQLIGLDPNEISGHSLRAGFVTSAVIHNARIDKIMEITRHKSVATVMKYIRDNDVFNDHAGNAFL